jgi:thymidylate synthase (FAD)
MEVKLISITKPVININEDGREMTAEQLIAYCARVSSPHQENPEYVKLLRYCITNQHWSIFELVDMTVEIITSRAIAQQILRHRSFSFQEFSQRYAEVAHFETYEARRQDAKNRQNSIDDLSDEEKEWFLKCQNEVWDSCFTLYNEALRRGIAKEQARFILPLNTQTRLYMKGSVRSWIHYLQLRCGNGTQKEHKEIADKIKEIFKIQFSLISEALSW